MGATTIKFDHKMDQGANEEAATQVFRNEVVLREIFKCLPTSTLISSCSLVNKLWREEACSFIRDNRKCTVEVGLYRSASMDRPRKLWKQLCELDRLLGKMDTIPFNSLRVLFTDCNADCYVSFLYEEEGDMNALTNLITRFPLKYLTVFEDQSIRACGICKFPVASAISQLVQENASTLLELESRLIWPEENCGVFKDWQPPQRFRSLKKLSIGKNSSITQDCAKKMIRGAPNLRSIHNNCLHMIPDVIPENMYGTLKRLTFGVKDVDDVEKIADKLDHLEELAVDFAGYHGTAMKIRCVALFRKLLESNMSTLCSLGIGWRSADLFNQLHLPQLASVKVLTICPWKLPQCLDHISALNFRGSLPNLRQVHIREANRHSNKYYGTPAVMFPQEDVAVAPNPSESTLELTIDSAIRTSDLVTLRSLFPNLIKLSFSSRVYLPPLGLTGILWPNLQSLSIWSQMLFADDTVIALREEDFVGQVFGLHPKEWKLLRKQDQEFLKRVHLVPSRPCLLTMRELKQFQLEFQGRSSPASEAFRQFLEPVVIGRMSSLSVKVKQVFIDPSWSIRDLFPESFFWSV